MRQAIIIIILAFSFINNSNSQTEYKYEYLNSLTKNFVSQLKNKNIDTILVYIDDCVTGDSYEELIYNNDSCVNWGYPPKFYCFWKTENKTYLRRIENASCYNYSTIEYDIDTIWKFVFNNIDKLVTERIKPQIYIENSDTFEVRTEHYCFHEFLIMTSQDTLVFELCNFFFEKYIKNEIKNLSYKDNWATKRKKLQLKLNDIVMSIDDNLLREKKYK